MKPVVFLGGGRITSALVAGLHLAGFRRPIVVYDRHAKKLKQLKAQYGVIAEPNLQRAVASAGLLIIAVRPNSVRALLQEIAPHLRVPLTAVSLAAGVPLAKLEAASGASLRWSRAMPSPVCRIGRGLTALAFARKVPASARAEIRNMFSLVGQIVAIQDQRFDAFTVTFSASHGCHALATLTAAAEAVGLDRKTAPLAAAHALAGGIDAWRQTHVPLRELLREAATPGGTAAAVMASFENDGYKKLVLRGLRAGLRQACKNAAR